MSNVHITLAKKLAVLEDQRRFYDNRTVDNAFHKDRPDREAKYLAARECVQLTDQLIVAHLAMADVYRTNR